MADDTVIGQKITPVLIQCLLLLGIPAGAAADVHVVPYMPPGADEKHQGFVRIVNHDNEPGAVEINAFDDSGGRHETSLSIGAGETRHFNSADLEVGNPRKGLSPGVGAGNGAWRLVLQSDLDVEVLAYVRTTDGFFRPSAAAWHMQTTFTAMSRLLPGRPFLLWATSTRSRRWSRFLSNHK